ncbi:PliI family lysozyme inhibitor of I-type lysozyme [Herminiimonas sp. NPDC097707]|uniref:PliI family lysozyme inhibitor of I-type lysozyme n=1 Tax=Herminiimonas sp. NPDC097707 TaxID=3364007 RepID=UPI003839DA08
MKKIALLLFSLTASLMITSSASAADKDRTVTATMPQGMIVVVSEGRMEPRSAGSYSLHLYAKNDPAYPYDRFIAGLVRPRNGTVQEIKFADVNGDKKPDIIVLTRYTGSGAFVTVDAFRFNKQSLQPLQLLTTIAGMDAGNDPVKALKKKLRTAR